MVIWTHMMNYYDRFREKFKMNKKRQDWERMFTLGQRIYEHGLKEGIEQGIAAFVKSYFEENIPKESSIQKLQK